MANPERAEWPLKRYAITLPGEATGYDLARIHLRQTEGRSLAASVALRMIEEAKGLMKEELDLSRAAMAKGSDALFDVEEGIDFVDWSGYMRPAYALLNAEEFLKSREPYETPDNSPFLKEAIRSKEPWIPSPTFDRDAFLATEVAEWHLQEAAVAESLRNNPLDFIDTVVAKELEPLSPGSRDHQKKKDGLKRGQERFHQLYEAAR